MIFVLLISYYSKIWLLHNYRHHADFSLGIIDMVLNTIGPNAMSIPVGPNDPNVDPNYQPADKGDGTFDATTLPCYLKEVRCVISAH